MLMNVTFMNEDLRRTTDNEALIGASNANVDSGVSRHCITLVIVMFPLSFILFYVVFMFCNKEDLLSLYRTLRYQLRRRPSPSPRINFRRTEGLDSIELGIPRTNDDNDDRSNGNRRNVDNPGDFVNDSSESLNTIIGSRNNLYQLESMRCLSTSSIVTQCPQCHTRPTPVGASVSPNKSVSVFESEVPTYYPTPYDDPYFPGCNSPATTASSDSLECCGSCEVYNEFPLREKYRSNTAVRVSAAEEMAAITENDDSATKSDWRIFELPRRKPVEFIPMEVLMKSCDDQASNF